MIHIPNVRRLALVLACIVLVALLALQVWTEGPFTRADLAITHWLAAGWTLHAGLIVCRADEANRHRAGPGNPPTGLRKRPMTGNLENQRHVQFGIHAGTVRA